MSIRDDVEEIKENLKYKVEKEESKTEEKKWNFPPKWNSKANKSMKKENKDMILVWYLSAKGSIEPPMLLKLYGGNLIIYKDKVHEFDPRALYNLKVGNKMYKVLIIKEIDRKPVSNLDWAEIKLRGDTTRNDEVLLKMLRLAMIEKVKKQATNMIFWVIGGLALAAVAYFVFFKK